MTARQALARVRQLVERRLGEAQAKAEEARTAGRYAEAEQREIRMAAMSEALCCVGDIELELAQEREKAKARA